MVGATHTHTRQKAQDTRHKAQKLNEINKT